MQESHMSKKETNTSAGFGIVGAVLIVVAVALVGLIGWRVYDTSKTKSASSSSQGSSNNQSSTEGAGTTQPTPRSTTTYLDIKELGVKIKLDDKTSGESYSYYTSSNGKGDGAVIIDSTMKIVDSANQYCKGQNAGMIGNLERSKDPLYFSNGASAVTVDNVTSFKLGDYYYVFVYPQAECSQDTAIGQQRTNHAHDFLNVLKTIQADQ